MIKSLQEIQQENRRLIMQIVHGCDFDKKAGYELDKLFEPITLSRVLLALPSELQYYKNGNLLFIAKLNQEPEEQVVWNLTKKTLEEQNEETQRAIYQLLNNN